MACGWVQGILQKINLSHLCYLSTEVCHRPCRVCNYHCPSIAVTYCGLMCMIQHTLGKYISYSQTSRNPLIQLKGRFCVMLSLSLYPCESSQNTKVCLNKNYSKVQRGEYLADVFPIKNVLEQGDVFSPLFLNCTLDYGIRKGTQTGSG